jgi:hypothetical protein
MSMILFLGCILSSGSAGSKVQKYLPRFSSLQAGLLPCRPRILANGFSWALLPRSFRQETIKLEAGGTINNIPEVLLIDQNKHVMYYLVC